MDVMALDVRRRNKILVTEDCWLWQGALSPKGYARAGQGRWAHRVVYEALVGPIPAAHDLDHMCENPQCVNPEHMRPVPHAQHLTDHAARRKTCRRGHPRTAENTYVWRGWHTCRVCARERS